MSVEQRRTLEAAMRAHPLIGAPVSEQRVALEALVASRPTTAGVVVSDSTLGGCGLKVVAPEVGPSEGDLLYLHGGGYVAGSAVTGSHLASHLVARTRMTAYALDYRLAPEHPHPAALADAVAAYRELLDGALDPDHVAIAGDSAGGGLTVALLVAIRDQGLPLPAGALLFSPFMDLAVTGTSVRERADVDPMLSADALHAFADDYLQGGDPRNPLASPLYADLRDLPPLLIQVGTHEVLLDDAIRLADRAADAGLDVALDVVPGMPRVFQSNAGLLDEADRALDRGAAFLRSRTAR